jgi:hypothetical protein
MGINGVNLTTGAVLLGQGNPMITL